MNWRPYAWYAGIAVVGFTAGRYRRTALQAVCPAPTVVERIVEKRVEVAAKRTSTLHVEQAPIRTVWRDRVVTVAGVDRIVREVERVEGPVRTVEVKAAQVDAKADEKEQTKTVTEYVRATWGVSARGGLDLDRKTGWGAGFDRHVWRGLWLGLEADSTRTAWLRARWEW